MNTDELANDAALDDQKGERNLKMNSEWLSTIAMNEAGLAAHVSFGRALLMEGCPEENFWYCLECFEAERRQTEEFQAIAKNINRQENHEELWEVFNVIYNNVIYTELVRYVDEIND